MKHIGFSLILTGKLLFIVFLFLCSCGSNTSKSKITAEMAYEGVSNYCHSEYDWSRAEGMYIEMGEESDSAYQVVFRSYTGAFVYFYVNKTDGSFRTVEISPVAENE